MKVKRVDKVTVELAPWERDALIKDIESVIAAYDRNGTQLYPLALHDFKTELEKTS